MKQLEVVLQGLITKDPTVVNENKDSNTFSTMRDLTAGVVSKSYALEHLLPQRVAEAHINGDIHFHDVDRFMRTVPFENIDVQNGIPISVEVNDLYHKVVEHQRGGFCYELNTLFKTYLIEKGFEVFNVSATFHTPGGGRSQPDSHMSTIVVIDGTHYIADVGFGDLPLQAIPLTEDAEHNVVQDVTGTFRAVFIDEAHKQFEVQKWENDAWDTKYESDISPRTIDMFEDNIKYNQTNPNSVFVKRLVITMPTEKGRATMSQNHLTLTEKGEKRKIDVTSDNYRQLLKTYFNLDVEIQRLET